MSEKYSNNTTPTEADTERQLLVKILTLLNNGSGIGGSGQSGVGSPEGVVTENPGSTYFQTDTESFWAKKTGTGNTGWIELIA